MIVVYLKTVALPSTTGHQGQLLLLAYATSVTAHSGRQRDRTGSHARARAGRLGRTNAGWGGLAWRCYESV